MRQYPAFLYQVEEQFQNFTVPKIQWTQIMISCHLVNHNFPSKYKAIRFVYSSQGIVFTVSSLTYEVYAVPPRTIAQEVGRILQQPMASPSPAHEYRN